MKVNLSVLERLMLGNILPKEGNFITLKVVKETQEKIGFTEEEHAILDFKNPGETYEVVGKDGKLVLDKAGKPATSTVPAGQMRWKDKLGEKEFDIGLKAVDVIAGEIRKMDEQKKLTAAHMSLYEKFVSEG